MAYFRKKFKYNLKKKYIYYKKKLNGLNILIKIVIELNNKFYILAIKYAIVKQK